MTHLWYARLPLVVVAVACSTPAPTDPQEAPVHLAPGVTELVDGTIYSASSQSVTRLSLRDVSRDGNRVAVLQFDNLSSATIVHDGCPGCPTTVGSAGGGNVANVFISEDSGVTWKRHDLAWDTWQGNGGPYGLHLGGGRAIILGENDSGSAVGNSATFTAREFDPLTDKYVANPAIDGKTLTFSGFPRGNGAYVVSADSIGNFGVELVQVIDMTQRTLKVVKPQYPVGIDHCGPLLFTDDTHVARLCSSLSQRCEVTYDLVGNTTASRCVMAAQWPAAATVDQSIVTARGLVAIGPDPTHGSIAVGLNAAGTVDVQPLSDAPAAGTLGNYIAVTHPPYAAFVGPGIIGVTATGATRFATPTPCVDSQCGVEVFLYWLEPMGDGSFLAFSRVNSRQPDPNFGAAYHDHLFVRRVTFTGGDALGPPAPPSGFQGLTGAHEASPIQAACLMAASCPGGNVDPIFACPMFWSQLPESDPARVAFLAAVSQGCGAMTKVFTNGACVYPNCMQNVPAKCDAAGPDHCTGNTVNRCNPQTPFTGLHYREDCGAYGQTCVQTAAGASCVRPADLPAGCSGQQSCQGTLAIWCGNSGAYLYKDCTQIGFTSCAANPGIQSILCK